MAKVGTHGERSREVTSGPSRSLTSALSARWPLRAEMSRPPPRHLVLPPEPFDAFVAWLGDASDRLVLLEAIPLEEIRSVVDVTVERVRRHLRSTDPTEPGPGDPLRECELVEILRSDHRWFESSLEEFTGLLRVVEGDDHGGHRQALGQYGRLVAAALTRHRTDEAALDRLRSASGARPLRNPN